MRLPARGPGRHDGGVSEGLTVLMLGDPRLRARAVPVRGPGELVFQEQARRLVVTLVEFRREHGFGRAIAAPQVGYPIRAIAMDLGLGPFLVVNPEITWRSRETFTIWDDCMCFPELLVRVRRHRSITVRFLDGEGQEHEWARLDPATSELFQHEVDHLDGVLAVDRAEGTDGLVHRTAYVANPEWFRDQVDAVIGEPATPPRRPGSPAPRVSGGTEGLSYARPGRHDHEREVAVAKKRGKGTGETAIDVETVPMPPPDERTPRPKKGGAQVQWKTEAIPMPLPKRKPRGKKTR